MVDKFESNYFNYDTQLSLNHTLIHLLSNLPIPSSHTVDIHSIIVLFAP